MKNEIMRHALVAVVLAAMLVSSTAMASMTRVNGSDGANFGLLVGWINQTTGENTSRSTVNLNSTDEVIAVLSAAGGMAGMFIGAAGGLCFGAPLGPGAAATAVMGALSGAATGASIGTIVGGA